MWLLVNAVGSFGLALFFAWSLVDEEGMPLWVATLGLFGGLSTLVSAGVEIRRRRSEDAHARAESDAPPQ
jgi:fluoride ion exporter CrcB/FEX